MSAQMTWRGYAFGSQLIAAFRNAGVVPPDGKIRRIIIDAPVDGVVKIYYETFGSDKFLKIDLAGMLGGEKAIHAEEVQA